MGFAVAYWYIWIKLMPKLSGYRVEEEMDELDDGTTITALVKVRDKEAVEEATLGERLSFLNPRKFLTRLPS